MTIQSQPLPLAEALVLYRVVHLAGRNLAPLTRLTYTRDLSELLAFLGGRSSSGPPTADRVRPQDLRAFLAALDGRGIGFTSPNEQIDVRNRPELRKATG